MKRKSIETSKMDLEGLETGSSSKTNMKPKRIETSKMDLEGSKTGGHLQELEQAAKSKTYALMWVVQMEKEVVNDNQIARKLLDVVKDVDKSDVAWITTEITVIRHNWALGITGLQGPNGRIFLFCGPPVVTMKLPYMSVERRGLTASGAINSYRGESPICRPPPVTTHSPYMFVESLRLTGSGVTNSSDGRVVTRDDRTTVPISTVFGRFKDMPVSSAKANFTTHTVMEPMFNRVVMMETLPSLVKEKVTEQVKKEVPAQVQDQVPVYLAEGLNLERKTTKEETERLISKAILQEHRRMQAHISSQIQNAIDNVIPSLVDASKTLEYEAYVSGESSSGQENVEEPGPSTLGNQEQDDEFDFWTDSYASDDDEIPTKQVTQDIMEEISLTIDEAKLKKMADEMLRQRCTSGDEHQYHIDQMKNFLQSDIVWESRKEILVSPHPRKITPLVQSCQRDPEAPALSLINQDLLYLKKGNSGPEKIVLSLHKFPAIVFNDDDIEERTSRWVNKCIKKFNPYARYGVENWKNPHAKILLQKETERTKKDRKKRYIQTLRSFKSNHDILGIGHEHKLSRIFVAKEDLMIA
ncbi:hypothetical protein Tco_1191518 [Tanacetum coccineum]